MRDKTRPDENLQGLTRMSVFDGRRIVKKKGKKVRRERASKGVQAVDDDMENSTTIMVVMVKVLGGQE